MKSSHSLSLILAFLILICFSCKKDREEVSDLRTQKLKQKIRFKLDSIGMLIPKSISFNQLDSSVVINNRNGSTTKRKLSFSSDKIASNPNHKRADGGEQIPYYNPDYDNLSDVSMYDVEGTSYNPFIIVCLASYTIGTPSQVISSVFGMASVVHPGNQTVIDPDGSTTTYNAVIVDPTYSVSPLPSYRVELWWRGEINYRITVAISGAPSATETYQTSWSKFKSIPY